MPLVYAELRNLATARMLRESAGHTLQPTALVHEAWLRLVGDGDRNWKGRAYFFATAASAVVTLNTSLSVSNLQFTTPG